MIQPATTKTYDESALIRLNNKVKFTMKCFNNRVKDPTYATELPNEIGLKLTNRCDLRCTHCFQWNELGYHNNLTPEELSKKGDLDINIISKLLTKTSDLKSDLYLWGGEPLVYSYWDELINLLEIHKRNTVICTNGLTLHKRFESLKRISDGLTILISLEGMEKQHDELRGKNTFKRIVDNVSLLLKSQNEGSFEGKVSVAAVISNSLIPVLYECCLYYENLGVDTLYFNFPWFIPQNEASMMDVFFRENFDWMGTDKGSCNSWHSFDWHLDENLLSVLEDQMAQIMKRVWNIRVRFQPNLSISDIPAYITGDSRPVHGKKMCLGISNRLDVLSDGSVTPCKKFIEFNVGNLSDEGLAEVWHGQKFRRFRETHNNTLMSICSKCEILYANGL